MLDQCPTSKKEGLPVEKPAAAALEASAATGKSYWRSLDELSGRPEFKEFVQREFPAYASELLDGSRRMFLKIMGAGLALAGAATVPGCRRPDHKLIPYNNQPEFVIAGKPLYYATALPLPGGGCEGLLAETYEGRPTKLEGNPLHPENLGKSSVLAQAQILDLYDPDRDAAVIAAMAKERGEALDVKPWAEFESFARTHFAGFDSSGGAGLAFLVEKATSPSRDALRDKIVKKWPKAKWLPYEAIDNEGEIAGTRIAFGSPMKPLHDLSRAKVIVSFDRDFAGGEGAMLADSRGFGSGRYQDGPEGHPASGSSMSRVYLFESMMSLIGGQSDHRFAVKPSRIAAAAAALAKAVAARVGGASAGVLGSLPATGGDGLPDAKVFDAIAEDLAANPGASVIMAGASQPAAVHALVAALNIALQNSGKTVRYVAMKGDAAASSVGSISALAAAIDKGEVDTLVTIGCNPVYDAPADLAFAEKYKKVANTIHLGHADETAQASKMHVARCHFLESWSDVESWDGVYSVVQPMIKPLFPSHNELELLATIAGEGDTDSYSTVRATVRGRTGLIDFEKKWRQTLHDGMAGPASAPAAAANINTSAVATAMAEAMANQADGIEVVFQACPFVHDGRFANNGWLQEVPHTVTKLTWDNPALVSPATARKLGITTDRHAVSNQYNHGEVVTLTVGGTSMNIAVWIQPGLADDTIVLHLGYGRRVGGRIAEGTGFNTYSVRSTGGMRIASGATVAKSKDSPYLLANVQDHWTMEGRDIFREVDHPRWKKFGDLDYIANKELQKDSYDRSRNVNFAGLMGMEGHTPANIDIYKGAQKRDQGLRFTEQDAAGDPLRDEKGNIVPIKNKYGKAIQQWGMSIDLTTCTGCAACVVACQAENNIPIVGKKEVAKGRELHWMRVDRYYATAPTGQGEKDTLGIGGDKDIAADPDMVVMPVTCVHCENAPCEVVCPVNATVHDEQGNNNMAYNRCIGTRYCSNNCPYKVRRFNFFDYGTKQFRGNFAGKDVVKDLPAIMQPPSEYFVPPRLREKKIEVATMQYNPHVTVRSRGVMEKCTYCIQRVNASRVETKLADLSHIPDGFVQTACQQACPTNAIVFGDIYDHDANDGKGSKVKQARNHGRSYQLLAYLNTRPRTTHMIRLRNPNPALVDETRRAKWDMPLGHHHHESHGDEPHGSEPKAKGHVMSLPILTQGALA
jgi:molybdopterin-containing oxidoreductase family iron-sulfur binding subunit